MLFAGVSLPLAVVPVVYFINHRYSGLPLWNIRGLPLVHESVWVASLVSFLFLYPSTFNLLEVRTPPSPPPPPFQSISHRCSADSIRSARHAQHILGAEVLAHYGLNRLAYRWSC